MMETNVSEAAETPLTVRQWILTLLLIYLPPVNLIFLLYWALGRKGNVSRRNFSRASLIMGAVNFALLLTFYMFYIWPMIMMEN
jgi:hypothetical protein